ncbi:hypothetical protein CP965_07280 [Halarcobacter mediterraneus]|uniref:Motility accessory factor n=1 Tax=Halarcobacter mediterraneus TaxID=2023153 RepID=A0A4Q1AUK5_9BACT|nr:6-hydroxymethylpterin diphosphokinase MptE-like protein [Halarcobacter mediterraneus]RXK13592.1 hypothetical protein CP965_07280 [Halarcobacter mediterraneus]
MTEEEAQNYAIVTFNDNTQYLEKEHPELFQKLSLFNTALEIGELKAQFDLHFIDGYFDIINLSNNQLLYGQDSFEVSKAFTSIVNTDISTSSFKAFYEQSANKEQAEDSLKKGLLSEYTEGNAPIINFVNNNLPQKQTLNNIYKFIIFGVGLGLHIPIIHEKLKSKLYLIVEPSLEIFRLSLFVTNYAKLAKEAKLILAIAQDEENFKNSFESFYNDSFIFNHYFKFFKLSDSFPFYTRIIQNRLVSQKFYLYPYHRTFLSLFRTNNYIMEGFKTLNISKVNNLDFTKKPILYLAAGPSLQKNIDFVKEFQDKFTIVAIYATLPLLEQHNIKPDIVTQYDEQDAAVLNTLEKIRNINFFDNTIFIFASHINAKLINSFKKENIYIFQAMFELKKDFGILTSPSIGELTYGLLLKLGAKEIYLLGLDLALDEETGKTHIEGHSGANAYNNLKEEEDSSDHNYSYRKNTIRVRGNLKESIKTTPVFKTNIDCFTFFTQDDKQKDTKVYNLSNGAYLADTIPLKIEDMNSNKLETKQENILDIIKKDLEKISKCNYSNEDLEDINLKISNSKKMKKSLESFFKIKNYKKFKDYENNLIYTLQVLLFENKSNDLKSILINYCQHNIPFIFHLFNTNEEKKNLSFIPKLNKILSIQLNKVIDTYLVSILYTKDEKHQLNKKLNKLVKEYKIEHTRYCEPHLKELSETAPLRESISFWENAIGIFAVNENLENKNLIEYISNIVNTYNCKLKIFYFFEYQKNKARQIFKNIKEKIEFIIPNSLESLASEIEVYIDGSKNLSLENLNEILVNKYLNILCIEFTQNIYIENKTLVKVENENTSLKGKLSLNKLPNSRYYNFVQSLNNVDEEKLRELYKKEHIGFFAFEENLTKYFVENIHEIANRFPNLKFSCFYFTEKQRKRFEKVFSNLLNRFDFIIPNDIYDIATNTEVWVQAEIKNQSMTYTKIPLLIEKTINIFNIIIDNKFKIKNDINSSEYLEYIIERYDEAKFIKSLNHKIDEKRIEGNYTLNSIGFLATEDSLKDLEFLNYIKQIVKHFPKKKVKGFIFDKEDERNAKLLFNNIENIEIIKIIDIYQINKNCLVWLSSSNFTSLEIRKYTRYALFTNFGDKKLTIKEYEQKYKKSFQKFYNNSKKFNILNNDPSFFIDLYNRKLEELQINYTITNEENYFDFFSFKQLEFALNYKNFITTMKNISNKIKEL